MVQLTPDKKAFGGNLISLTKAQKSIFKIINKMPKETKIKTKDSLNRILSKPIIAPINVPPYSNSAVDGYAIRYKDLISNKDKEFKLIGKSKAGKPYNKLLSKNDTVRVLTGAIIPKNADTVVMEEDCIINKKQIYLPKNILKGINFRLSGEDIKKNSEIFKIGHKIKPQDIGILNSLGIKTICTYKAISVAIFSCGDELTNFTRKLKYGKLFDSNRAMLISFLNLLNVKIIDLGIIPDKPKKIIKTLDYNKTADLIISTGGMSLGDEDHIKRIIEEKGSLKLWRIAMKPGRPVGFGTYKNKYFLGLPGNPAAAFVTFLIIGVPIIKKLLGQKTTPIITHKVPINFHHNKKSGRKEFLRVKLDPSKNLLYKFPKSGAGILSSTSWANGLGIINEEITSLKPKDKLLYISFNELIN